LVPHLGLRDTSLLQEFDGFVGGTTIAQTIVQQAGNRKTSVLARRTYRLGLVLDPATPLNQVSPAERPRAFEGLDFAFNGPWSSDSESLSADAEILYVSSVLNEQRQRGATVLVSAYHFGGALGRARDADIRLAALASAHFAERGLASPPAGEEPAIERELYCGIALHVADLRDELARRTLVESYSGIGGFSGYWVKVAGLSEHVSASDAFNCSEFLFTLQLISQVPVVLVGAANLNIAFLASGLGGTCLGFTENENVYAPRRVNEGPRTRAAHMPELLRNIACSGSTDEAHNRTRRVFRELGCRCGHHPADSPPSGPQTKRHSLSRRMQDAFSETAGPVEHRELRFSNRVPAASALGEEFGYPPLRVTTWLAVAAAANHVRAMSARAGES
jgi:hypothetical protein